MSAFTKNSLHSFWRYCIRGNKRIKLAVIGTPSSGKSYILNDIIQSFNLMGLTPGSLPLSFPYSNFFTYFKDISNKDGTVPQTVKYACRQYNHYGAVFTGINGNREVDIEFVNIPGEVFTNGQDSMAAYFDLEQALQRTGKGIFTVTAWESLSKDRIYVVEPTDNVRHSLNLPVVDKTHSNPDVDVLNPRHFENWYNIYSYLNNHQYFEKRETRRDVTGKYLLDHFYEFMTDSLMQSIKDAWAGFATKVCVSKNTFVNEQLDRDFYFCKYCKDATDFVVCDKLFSPDSNTSASDQKAALDFTTMTCLLNGFLTSCRKSKRLFGFDVGVPNVYLAFRGADMMLDEGKVRALYEALAPYKGQRDNIVYSCLVHQLNSLLSDTYHPQNLGRWLGVNEADMQTLDTDILRLEGLTTVTNFTLENHIRSRIGTLGSGFLQLVNGLGNKKKVACELTRNIPVPPHVYFTATPIDNSYCIYQNDSSKQNLRFVRRDDSGRVVAFNAIGRPLCFGTFQLATDLLIQNGVRPANFRAGELVSRLRKKLK